MAATTAMRRRERLKKGGEGEGKGEREWKEEIKEIMKEKIFKSDFANLTKAISRIFQTILHISLDD